MFKMFLNDIELTEHPEGWEDLSTTIKFDKELNTLATNYNSELTFYGQGYEILNNIRISEGYCTLVPFKVFKDSINGYYNIIDSYLFLSDTTWSPCLAKISVFPTDKDISAFIKNNKDIRINISSNNTKNSTVTTPITTTLPTEIFLTLTTYPDPLSAGTNHTIVAYDFHDIMDFIVAFISDNEIAFYSEWYTNLPSNEKIAVTSGSKILNEPAGNEPVISFFEVYDTMRKCFNLVMYFDKDSLGNKRLRIEQRSKIENSAPVASVECRNDLTIKIDTERLYSKIIVGNKESSKTSGEAGRFSLVNFLNFRKEEYHIQGKCNGSGVLDLTTTMITDHNLIWEALQSNEDEYIDSNFLLNYNGTQIVVTDPFSTGTNYAINEIFTNMKTLSRYQFHGDFAYFFGDGNDQAQAIGTNVIFQDNSGNATSWNLIPLQFQDDHTTGYDPNNNYGNGTIQGLDVSQANSRYTAPSDGIYTLSWNINYRITRGSSVLDGGFVSWDSNTGVEITQSNAIYGGQFIVSFVKYSSAGTELDRYSKTFDYIQLYLPVLNFYDTVNYVFPNSGSPINRGPITRYTIPPVYETGNSDTISLNLLAGEYIQIEHEYDQYETPFTDPAPPETLTEIISRSFTVDSVFDTGGHFPSNSGGNYNLSLLNFEYFLNEEQIKEILNNKLGSIDLINNCLTENLSGYINNIVINHSNNSCIFELRSKTNIQ
jgi:hypothetical protein